MSTSDDPDSGLTDFGLTGPAPIVVPTPVPEGWTVARPDEDDAAELTDLLRVHEKRGRGWAGASEDDLLVEVSARGYLTRENVVLRDPDGRIRGWAGAHDRAAGRM